jgi:hypothetical protein
MKHCLSVCSILALFVFCGMAAARAWDKVALPDPREVEMSGEQGEMLRRGIARIGQPPYTVPWILSDVSFELKRLYTNFSGDVSGRFIELASLTSPPGTKSPAALAPVLEAIARYQKPDGHFGVEVNLDERLVADAPALTLLWGNARLLNGLLAAAERFNEPRLLDCAKRLGDFYVATADKLCDPRREAEYAASGSYGHSYRCDYFPAIESLALLYKATNDRRYLNQARRMARWFWEKFDVLPNDHAHGNLCAWRGILLLYEITGEREYLDRAVKKWEYAVCGGFVWPTGGMPEKWHVFFHNDEGCALSDWLRFNLELWRHTGDVRYLDMAERLLLNQYAANQSDDGAFGNRYYEGDWHGVISAKPNVKFGPFHPGIECCTFHGPLGLWHLKSYLAAGSSRGIYINFPLDYTAIVETAGCKVRVAVRTKPIRADGKMDVNIALAAADREKNADAPTTLWLRVPPWAKLKLVELDGKELPPKVDNGYLRIEGVRGGDKIHVSLHAVLMMEGYRFVKHSLRPGKLAVMRNVSFFSGPQILAAALPGESAGRPTLVVLVDGQGRLAFPAVNSDGWMSVALFDADVDEKQISAALKSAKPIAIRPWLQLPREQRAVFSFDAAVVPAEMLPAAWKERLSAAEK